MFLHRKLQLAQKQEHTNKYNSGYRDTTGWLTAMERKLSQLQPVAMDLRNLAKQEKQIKVMEVKYKMQEKYNRQGSILHFFTHRTQGPTRLVIHRSLKKNVGFPV